MGFACFFYTLQGQINRFYTSIFIFSMNIYVANIPFALSEEELEAIFAEYGAISSVKIIKDKLSGQSRGFGFVEMENDNEGDVAVEELDGFEVRGRELKVKKAYPRKPYAPGGGGQGY